jgi:hypothetical protein
MTTAEALIAAWVLLTLLLAAIILLIMRGPRNSRR